MSRLMYSIIFWYKDLICESKGHNFAHPNPLEYETCTRCGVVIDLGGNEDVYYSCMYRSAMILRISRFKRPICKLKGHNWRIRGQADVCQRCGKRRI